MFIGTILATALAFSPASQSPQTATNVDEVVVNARQLEEQVASFIGDITVPDANLGIARMHRDVCVSVVNMRNDSAQYIIDRVAMISLELGIKPGAPGCKPNVLVIATADARDTTEQMVARNYSTFMPDVSGARRTSSALQKFKDTDLPVRWWQTSIMIDPMTGHSASRRQNDHLRGEFLIEGDVRGPTLMIDFPIVETTSTKLRSGIRSELASSIIVLDMEKMSGISVPQIADYIAMIALTRVDMDSNFSGYDSVLSLASNKSFPGLSEWDLAYLKSVYSADLTQRHKSHQMNEVRWLMSEWQIRRPLRRQAQTSGTAAP